MPENVYWRHRCHPGQMTGQEAADVSLAERWRCMIVGSQSVPKLRDVLLEATTTVASSCGLSHSRRTVSASC